MREKGYAKLKDYGQLLTNEITTKDVTLGFGYSESDDGSGFAGIFLSIANDMARFQLKSNLNTGQLKFRQTDFNGTETSGGWIDIALN